MENKKLNLNDPELIKALIAIKNDENKEIKAIYQPRLWINYAFYFSLFPATILLLLELEFYYAIIPHFFLMAIPASFVGALLNIEVIAHKSSSYSLLSELTAAGKVLAIILWAVMGGTIGAIKQKVKTRPDKIKC